MQAKTLCKVIKAEQLEKMLQHFELYKFIKIVNKNCIQLDFLAENLKEFIRKEWLLMNVTCSDHPAFLFKSLTNKENLKTAFDHLRNLVSTAPFSLVEVNDFCQSKEEKLMPELNFKTDIMNYKFRNEKETIMRNMIFCSSQNALEIFYQKQREHKMWWRKFSALPGRFVMSNASSKDNRTVTNEIQAEFPWGLETVEIIKYLPDFCAGDKDLEIYTSKRKKSAPHVVACEISLENAAFTYLCDSYERLNGDQRDVLKFNKKLAPYKVSIAGIGTSSEVKNLEELSLLLAKQVRKLGFPVLFLPDAFTLSVERQVLRNDAIGVPYTLLLNEKTLKDGSITLRSRDTTLEEESHVSLAAEYLATILK